MDLGWVRDGQRLRHGLVVGRIDAPVLELKGHLEVSQRVTQLVSLAEVTREVVVCRRPHPLVLLTKKLRLLKQFKRQFRVVTLKSLHGDYVADKRDLVVYSLELIVVDFARAVLDDGLALVEATQSFHVLVLFFEGQTLFEELGAGERRLRLTSS